jgi:VCBS repeat-containing protein
MANSVPTLTRLTTPVTFLENTVNAAPQIIDADVTFTNADNNFDGGTLTIAGLLAQDTVAIRNQGTGAGQIGVSGSNVTFGGSVIGSFAGGGGSTLTVTFNAAATAAGIEALIENLTYANSSDTPTASRSLELKVTDAAGFAATIAPLAEQTGAANPFNGIDVGFESTPSFADLDGDGDLDALVGENDGTLRYFENTGSATAPAFTARTGAANPFDAADVGYLSAPSFADLDGDGDLDAVVGEYFGTLRYFENTGSATAPAFTARIGAANPFNGVDVGLQSAPSFADLDGDGDLDAVIGEEDGNLNYFENTGSATAPAFTARAGAANPFNGVDVGLSSTPSFADLDGDGDLDAVVGEQFGALSYFQNTGSATAPAFTARTGAANPFNGVDVGDLGTPSFADFDGDGHLDAVVGEDNGNLNYFLNTTPPAPDFAEQTGAANPFNTVDVGAFSAPSFADLDGDGDLDAVVGEYDGTLNYFENTGSAIAPAFTARTGAANPFNGVDLGYLSAPSFADLDGDGDLDAVVGEYNGTLRYFENTGSAIAPAFTARTGPANPFDGVDVGTLSTLSFADLDSDGDLDAIVGASDGTAFYFENTGSAIAPAFTARTGAANPFNGIDVGNRSAPSFADLDGDGDLDAVIGEQDGNLNYFRNTGSGFALVVNVTAQNDAAVLSADVRNLTETNAAAAISSSGTLTISDVDSPATFVAQPGTAGSYGTFAITSAGAWTYTASSAHDEFVAGTTYTDTFQVASADGTPTSVTINILGTNDAAVLSADVRNLTETNAAADISASGTLTISDADSPATFVAQAGTLGSYGTFAIDSAGAWTYTASSAHNAFAAGTTYTDTFQVASADGTPTSVTINIGGSNDAAVLSADVRNLTETNAAAAISSSGTLTISDVDSPATFVAQAGTVGSYGTFAIDSAGAWTYTASSAHNELVAGTTYTDTFQVASADGTPTSVTINILGANDAAASHDFSSDSKSDILWQNGNGTAAVWLMDGTSSTFVGAVGPFNPGPAWHIEGIGDFNGDGKSDIIWQGDNGAAAMWLMDGPNAVSVGAVGPFNPGPAWHIEGIGDFNGDGNSDIIWQGDNGAAAMWLMDGTNAEWVGAVGPFNPGPSWEIKGTGDFNGDGNSDIIWQGDNGTAAMWLMDGPNATFVGAVGSNPGPSWEIKGTGDFNGDGKSDILWQGQDGTPAIWLMDGTNVTFAGAVGPFNPGPSWHIEGTGDFNGDSKSDILWQNDDGTPVIWTMDGTNVVSIGAAGSFNPGSGLARHHLAARRRCKPAENSRPASAAPPVPRACRARSVEAQFDPPAASAVASCGAGDDCRRPLMPATLMRRVKSQ